MTLKCFPHFGHLISTKKHSSAINSISDRNIAFSLLQEMQNDFRFENCTLKLGSLNKIFGILVPISLDTFPALAIGN